MDKPVWELAHPDGSSIFVRHSFGLEVQRENPPQMLFGPFLFLSEEAIMAQQGTNGPHNLLRPLGPRQMRSQKVSLDWVKGQLQTCFAPANPDCIVLEDLLIPMSINGAILADVGLNRDNPKDEWINPWTTMSEHWGGDAMRIINAELVVKMLDPGIPN
jgi:hypothetical protein